MSAPFSLPLRWSPSLCVLVVCAHLLPVGCALAAAMPLPATLAIVAACAVSGVCCWRESRRLVRCQLSLVAEGESLWLEEGGAPVEVLLQPDFADLGWLIVMQVREAGSGRLRRVTLLRDALDKEGWRRLRRILRQAQASQTRTQPG